MQGNQIFFDDGIPDITRSPINELARAYRRVFKQKAKWQIMNLSNKLGDLRFREALSEMLNQNRQMRTCAAQLCVTRGSQMALFLTAHCLLKKDDVILVENPGFKPAWETFRYTGATIVPIAVEPDGIRVDDVERIVKKGNVKAIYLTPHHQYPTMRTRSPRASAPTAASSPATGCTTASSTWTIRRCPRACTTSLPCGM